MSWTNHGLGAYPARAWTGVPSRQFHHVACQTRSRSGESLDYCCARLSRPRRVHTCAGSSAFVRSYTYLDLDFESVLRGASRTLILLACLCPYLWRSISTISPDLLVRDPECQSPVATTTSSTLVSSLILQERGYLITTQDGFRAEAHSCSKWRPPQSNNSSTRRRDIVGWLNSKERVNNKNLGNSQWIGKGLFTARW